MLIEWLKGKPKVPLLRTIAPASQCGVRIVPVAGAEGVNPVEFPVEVDTILLGRDPSWGVRDPASPERHLKERNVTVPNTMTGVGRRHVLLQRQPAGGWMVLRQMAQNDYYYVEVNGSPHETAVRDGATLHLGPKNGPTFRFELVPPVGHALSGVLVTDRQPPTPNWWEKNRTIVRGGSAALVLVAVAIGGLTVEQGLLNSQVNSVWEKFRAAEKAGLQAPAGFEGIDKVRDAAHLVVVRRGEGCLPLATAWPISASEMVTNAHVAAELATLHDGDQVSVCPPGSGSCYPLVGKPRLHPSYAAFQARLGHDGLGSIEVDGTFNPIQLPGAYDVAILEIDAGSHPPEPLTPASRDELSLSLETGRAIAFAGYPIRDTDGEAIACTARVPLVHYGSVSATTDFLMSLLAASDDQAQLVHNTIAVTGGASGGPVVNQKGEVVAVVSSGEVICVSAAANCLDEALQGKSVTKVPNAALVNYAQRVDLVDDLRGRARSYEAYWDAEMAKFRNYHDYVLDAFVVEASDHGAHHLTEVLKPVQQAVKAPFDFKEFPLQAQKDKTYALLAYGADPSGLKLSVAEAENERPGDADRADRAARFVFRADHDGEFHIDVTVSTATNSAFELRAYRID
jgi:hypothetical protein